MRSRLEARRKEWASAEEGRHEDDYRPDMPPIDGDEYLIGILFEIGPGMPAGMSSGPISHQEIAAWCQLTGTPLQPWEARLLRRLSVAYVNESQKATTLGCPAPWQPAGSKPEPSAAQLALRALSKS